MWGILHMGGSGCVMNCYYFESFHRDKVENFSSLWRSLKQRIVYSSIFMRVFSCEGLPYLENVTIM